MRKKEYLEQVVGKDFYDFYRKNRKKPSKIINQQTYFEKAIGGLMEELRVMITETEHGVHLKGLGVLYKKPFGNFVRQIDIFNRTRITRKKIDLYIEDDFIRRQYLITNTPSNKGTGEKDVEDKSAAIILHRKLKLKK